MSAGEKQRVEDHLKDCGSCARELEDLSTTVALLRLTPVVKPPRSFALREQVVARPRWQGAPILRWSMGLAVAMLVFLAGGDVLTSVVLRGAPFTGEVASNRSVAPAIESLRAPVPGADERTKSGIEPPTAAQSAPIPTAIAEDRSDAREGTTLQSTSKPPEPVSPLGGLSILRIAEIGLGALILVLGVASFLARRVWR